MPGKGTGIVAPLLLYDTAFQPGTKLNLLRKNKLRNIPRISRELALVPPELVSGKQRKHSTISSLLSLSMRLLISRGAKSP